MRFGIAFTEEHPMRRDMTFQSKGLTCRGWFYMPDGLGQGQKAPTTVMAHGFSAVKEMYLQDFAERFAANGLACLVFDYRYLGASDGEPRGQIFPWEQIIVPSSTARPTPGILRRHAPSRPPGVTRSRLSRWSTSSLIARKSSCRASHPRHCCSWWPPMIRSRRRTSPSRGTSARTNRNAW